MAVTERYVVFHAHNAVTVCFLTVGHNGVWLNKEVQWNGGDQSVTKDLLLFCIY